MHVWHGSFKTNMHACVQLICARNVCLCFLPGADMQSMDEAMDDIAILGVIIRYVSMSYLSDLSGHIVWHCHHNCGIMRAMWWWWPRLLPLPIGNRLANLPQEENKIR